MKTFLTLTVAAAAFTLSAPADAVTYHFNISGDYSASWSLDSHPNPDLWDDDSFTLWDVVGDFPASAFNEVDLTFYTANFLGGLTIFDFWGGGTTLIEATGGQLFSGLTSEPVFQTGSYALTDLSGQGDYVLVISGVPEPAAWGLMIAGFGLIGTVLRRRRVAHA